jgi:PAS domain S-box-containing protein
MWITDLNTFKFLNVNKMAILQYGYSREEFLSMTAIDIRPGETKESFIQLNESFDYDPTNFNKGIWNHQKKNGTIIPVEIIAHEIIYEGVPARFILSNNITDRKKSEEALWNSEEKFRNLINFSPVGITLSSSQGEILQTNQTIIDILGFESKEEFINIPASELYVDKNDRKQLIELFKKEGVVKNFETRLKRKNGELIWVSSYIHPFKLPNREMAILSTILDITDRKKAELKLERQNKELAFQNDEKENRAAELIIANKELAFQNEEKEDRAAELIIANKELAYQNDEKENRAAELIIANKELAFQNEEKENRAAELIIANHELAFQNEEKENRAAELVTANHELAFQNEEKENRAAELIIANHELAFQNEEKENRAAELIIANKELAFQNEEKENRAAELIIANHELAFQNEEKENRAAELVTANHELAFQNEEKENRAAELIIANKELAFQNEEKENRAAELIIANKELAFQNDEKENRAAELVIANKELAFQNEEKENRASELIIANKELAFQNEEKENRAAELIIANKELAFQNEEKENRASELIIANKELAFQNEEKENRASELIIANKELAFQNEEKENRAAELVIANHELEFQNEEKENRATELIITNDELIKTNTELDRFVYSVSHDLRSPLTSVLGLVSFIEEESQEADTLEHVKMIRNSINRLDEFIKNILSYSRNNRTRLEVEQILLQETATAIVNSLHRMKEAKGIIYEININEQQPFYTDRLRFNTVMENLISNAIKYHTKAKSGRYVKITGQSDHEKLQIKIADNGIGIAPAYHQKIFDMFFRLSGKTNGSGIGLYIVKDTIEILQGSIAIQSEKGTGTTFIITLKNLKP